MPVERKSLKLEAPRQRRIGSAYQLLKDGATKADVIAFMTKNTSITEFYAQRIVNKAESLLEINIERDLDVVTSVHAKRYDLLYENAKNLHQEWIKYPQEKEDYIHNNSIIEQYKVVLKALHQKERIYSLHSADASRIITDVYFEQKKNESKIIEGQIDRYFDYNKLTPNELEEMVEILEKAVYREEEKVKAPDRSKETITSTPVADEEVENHMLVPRKPGIQEINIKTQKQSVLELPPHLAEKQKSTNEVRESLKEAMMAKIKKTYEKQDEGRGKNNVKSGFKQN